MAAWLARVEGGDWEQVHDATSLITGMNLAEMVAADLYNQDPAVWSERDYIDVDLRRSNEKRIYRYRVNIDFEPIFTAEEREKAND